MQKHIYLLALTLLTALFSASACFAEKVAITFDDLPLNGELPAGMKKSDIAQRVLRILQQRQVPQVFGFINAAKLEGNPDGRKALQLWVRAGQRLGNHTYSHMDLHQNAVAAFIGDLERNEPALREFSAHEEWRWLRYPYLHEGDTRDKRRAVRSYLNEHHYQIAEVTLDYEDYLWNTPYARCLAKDDRKAMRWLRETYLRIAKEYIEGDRAMAQLVFGRPIDHVLLLHLGAFSEAILPAVLDLLKSEGFQLATLEEVQSDPAYRTDPDAGSKGGSLLEGWMDVKHLGYPPFEKKPYKELEAICR